MSDDENQALSLPRVTMPRFLLFALFITVAVTVTAAIHGYLWLRLVRDPGLAAPWRLRITLLLVALWCSIPLSFALRPVLRAGAELMSTVAYTWLGLMFLLLVLVAATDVLTLLLHVVRVVAGAPPLDPERRQLLARAVGAAVALSAGGLGAAAAASALGRVKVVNITVPLRRLPPELDGLTLVQISDLHVGNPTLGARFVEHIARQIDALAPDVLAITGDLVDGSVEELRDVIAPLARLRPRLGTYFVTGNHEYYSGAVAWCEHLASLGIRVLRNERVTVGSGAASFELAGIDDSSARGMAPGHGPDLARALDGWDPSRELVLLAHQPRAIHEAAARGVGLQLSGHTHGGQIWPFTYLVRLQQPYVAGLARERDTAIYVSCGTGYWGPPMRLGVPAEITRITLRSGRS